MGSFEQMPNSYLESGKKKVVSLPEDESKKGVLKFGDRRWKMEPAELEKDPFLLRAYEMEKTDIIVSASDTDGDSYYEISMPLSIVDEKIISAAESNGWEVDLSGKEFAIFDKNNKNKTVH